MFVAVDRYHTTTQYPLQEEQRERKSAEEGGDGLTHAGGITLGRSNGRGRG
jgi:hypothetical protein